MTLVPSHPQPLNGNNLRVKKYRLLIIFFMVFVFLALQAQQTPESFISHKVKKRETIFGITRSYNISESQLIQFNPLIEKVGLKKRMLLRIPVYKQQKKEVFDTLVAEDKITQIYIVKPKDTKWRLAYNFKITIPELEALNPKIQEGLIAGQQIKVPKSIALAASQTWNSEYNYYTVRPKEGYYRIEKKIGVTRTVLDSLNPQISELGLQAGMVLRVPGEAKGEFRIENDLLVEKLSLLDSINRFKAVKLAVLLPFKANEIEYDSIEDTQKLLKTRNLHTISTDFYSGILLAADTLSKRGISIKLNTFDTENSISKINRIINNNYLSESDIIIGPLIPSNFDFLSTKQKLLKTPKVAPLSTNPISLRPAVFQSVTSKDFLRARMLEYLDRKLNREDNIVLVVDSINRPVEGELLKLFPKATILRPEKSNYLIPELVDSLLVDSLPNRVILESQDFSLISSASSQMSAQQSDLREVQLFTTYRGNAYENQSLSRKQLGSLNFTYTAASLPYRLGTYNDFQKRFIKVFGKPPSRTVIRAYDLTMDLVLRFAFTGDLEKIDTLGETDYEENRFLYVRQNNSFSNRGYYLLQHRELDIIEVKK